MQAGRLNTKQTSPRGEMGLGVGIVSLLSAVIAVIAVLFMGSPARGQTAFGTISGTITDPSGAVVPNVAVTLRNTATGQVRNATTNSTGYFSAPALPPGPYSVGAKLKGFESSNSNVDLTLGANLNVSFQLKLGSENQTVQVVAQSAGLETESHSLTDVMSAQTLENTPAESGYRNGTFYAQSTEVGVQPGSNLGANNIGSNVSQYNQQSNQLFIGGQGYWSSSYLLDGVVDMSYFDQTATVETPVEATEQVEIVRNGANARYDGSNALNAITKSGTDQFHGRVYEYLQNAAFDARGYNAGPLKENNYNMFGANAGWYVPFTHKKVFFFVDYQGYRQVNAAFIQSFVPTAAERAGDFSADLVANAETKQPGTIIYDPTSYNPAITPNGGANALTQFSYNGKPNVINPALISPLATQYLNLVYPLPNFINTNPGKNYGSKASRVLFNHDDWLFRGDYNPSPKDHLYGAYDTNNPQIVRPEQWDSGASTVQGESATGSPLVGLAEDNQLYGTDIYITETHVLSPTVVNTAHIGFARSVNGQQFGQINNGTDYLTLFHLKGLSPPPTLQGLPNINPGGFSGPSGSPLGATQNMYEYVDEVDWTRGHHSLYAGGEIDVIDYNAFWYNGCPNGCLSTNGEYTYNGSSQAAWQRPGQWLLGPVKFMPAANQLADFLLGDYVSTNASGGSQAGHFHQHNIMPYFQDNWRIAPKLTLNLGLRYDYYSSPSEQEGHAGYLIPQTGQYNPAPYNPNKYDFSPRLGFAYAYNDKTAVHGGFGIYYFQYSYYDLQYMADDPLYNTNLTQVQSQATPVIWPSSSPAPNPDTGANPGQQEFLTSADAQTIWSQMPSPSGVFQAGGQTFAQKFPTSYSEQYNVAIQRSFGRNWLLTVDYLGSEDHHLYGFSNINLAALPGPNDPNPTSTADIQTRRPYQAVQGNIEQAHKWLNSNYNAGEVELKKTFSNGFEVNTNYVWEKGMDFQDSDHSNFSQEMGNNPGIDYGREGFIAPYVFKLSGIYELPFGKNKQFLNQGKWWENQIGGWRLSGFLTVNGGPPFSVGASDNSNTGGGIGMRAEETCNGNNGPHTFAEYINISCFKNPAENTFGNQQRNSLTGPRNTNVDLSVFKEFPIYNRLTFQFRVDAFSALNHPLPQLPDNNVNDGNFGEITGWGGARSLQFSGKVLW